MVVVASLLIGGAGGAIGYLLARGVGLEDLFDPDADLTKVTAGVERPPNSVSDLANRVRPAVVSIEVRGGSGQGATGSGVVIAEDGYIITNNHVLAAPGQDASIRVLFEDKSSTAARTVGTDPKSDLAVIKVDSPVPSVASLGDSGNLAVGDSVLAIGSPLGLAGSVTTGIVSALERPVPLLGEGTDADAVVNAIQTDAAINPGNSGGALIDATGAVIGINTALATVSGSLGETPSGNIGVGFAIPINEARNIAEQLIRTGHAVHASIGVNSQSTTQLNGTRDGAMVEGVQPGGAAEKAGIREGDVIVQVNEDLIVGRDQLTVAIRSYNVGERVAITYVRDGEEREVDVVLQAD